MNLCDAFKEGRKNFKAIRNKKWNDNLSWYHGLDNIVRWYNSDPNSICSHKTGDIVSFCIADIIDENYELQNGVHYRGDLINKI
jgi:hypothetical protein